MRAYISRLLIVSIFGSIACLGIYLFAQNPTLFTDISTSIGPTPGWKNLSINSSFSFDVLAVNQGCASNTLYAVFGASTAPAASKPAGLYASADRGETWSLVLDLQSYNLSSADPQILCGDGSEIVLIRTTNTVLRIDPANKRLDALTLPQPNSQETITSLEPDPWDNRIVYAAGSASGLWQSLDYGLTWKTLAPPIEVEAAATITSAALDYQQPANLFVSTTGGFYQSSDQGITWERTGRDLPLSANTRILDIEWDPGIPDQVYLILGYNFSFQTILVKSSDHGVSWSFLGNGPGPSGWVTALKADHGTIFAITSLGLYRSMDEGMGWEKLDVPSLGKTSEINALRVDPITHDLYLRTTRGLLLSKDKGLSWSVLMPTTSPTINSISANRLYYAGSNQGILFSGDAGASWISRNSGLFSQNISVVQVHPSQPELVFAGTADGKIFRSEDSGLNWRSVWAGEAPVSLFLLNEQSPDTVFATTQAGDLLLSEDMGDRWRRVESQLTGQITDGTLSADELLVVLNGNELWQSRDKGNNWSQVAIDYVYSRIDDIAVKPGAFFAILDGSTLLRSADGTSWQRTVHQPVQSGMQEILNKYDDSPILYLKTSTGLFFSESNGDAWQEALNDSSASIHIATLDSGEGVLLAVTDLNVLAGKMTTRKTVQRENLTKLFLGREAAADQVIVISEALQVTVGTALLILIGLLFCLFLMLLNIPFFLSFLWNTVEILFIPDRTIHKVNTGGFAEDRPHPFFFAVWSCVISFGIFFFSYWLSIPFQADELAKTSIFKFFTMDLLALFPTLFPASWQWEFFLTAAILVVFVLLYSAFNSVALKFLFGSDEDFGWIFSQSFSFTWLVVSAWINLLILWSLAIRFAGFHSLFLVVSAIWFGILNVRFIHQVTSLPVDESAIAFGCTLVLPLVGLISLAFILYGYLRTWPWKEAVRLLIVPILNLKTVLANASQLVGNRAQAKSYLLAYAISLAPILVFVSLRGGVIVSSPLYSLWHEIWAVWLFPPLFATLAEIFSQWLNTNEFPTRYKEPAQLFGWTRTNLALILFIASLNFWARTLGLLSLLAFGDPTTKLSIEVIYSLTVVGRFAAMVFAVNQVYPSLLRSAANRLALRSGELMSRVQIRDHWNFIKLTFTNPSAVLTHAGEEERPGGSKPMNIFLLSVVLLVLATLFDLLLVLRADPSVANFGLLLHRLFIVLLLVCIAFATALTFSYLFLADVLKEDRRHALFNAEGNLQIFPGYVQVVELTLFVVGLFTIMSSLSAFLMPPGMGRFVLIFFLWAGFFLYASLIFAGIGNIKLEDLTFSRLFFRSVFQAIVAGIWSVSVWVTKAADPSTSNSISIILEWQEMLLTKARADVYFNRIGKYERAKLLYRSILEKSKVLKRVDFRDWNLPKDLTERYGLPFVFLPEPEVTTNALPLQALITSTLINLSTLDISESLNYINESMDDNAPATWERLSECREGAVHALAQILMENKELVVQNIASLIPRNVPSQVIFEISDLLPDKSLSSLYLAFGKLVGYSA